jgi:hypothetical protein
VSAADDLASFTYCTNWLEILRASISYSCQGMCRVCFTSPVLKTVTIHHSSRWCNTTTIYIGNTFIIKLNNWLSQAWPHTVTVNPLMPNDTSSGRTAPLTSKRRILYIYSTNIGTEYFKHGICSPIFFPLQNAVCFIILMYLVPVLFTFYIQGVIQLKK